MIMTNATFTREELARVIKMHDRGLLTNSEFENYCKQYHWWLGTPKPRCETVIL